MLKLARKALIWGVYVDTEARTLGLGAEILGHALKYAATGLGARQVNIGVNTRNTAAVALHKRLGFVECGHERSFLRVGGEFHGEYQMACLALSAP